VKRAAALVGVLLSACAAAPRPFTPPEGAWVSARGVQTYRGRWIQGFEVSLFQGCWLEMRDAEPTPGVPPPAGDPREIVFEGVRLSAPDGRSYYGHMANYPCLFRVARLVDPRREAWPGPPPAGPPQPYRGIFRFGFAQATFEDCWLSLRGTAWEAFERRHPDYEQTALDGNIAAYEIAFEGVKRTSGRYGHLGGYTCEYEATRLLDSRPAPAAPTH